jgi:hypothetical protein
MAGNIASLMKASTRSLSLIILCGLETSGRTPEIAADKKEIGRRQT